MSGEIRKKTYIGNIKRIPSAVWITVILLSAALIVFMVNMAHGKNTVVTYSLYPYLPETEYCTEVLEEEWEKIHPDITLEYVPYDCYFGGKPEGIDVIMYDTILEREFIEKGYIKPLNIPDYIDTDDFNEFTLGTAAGFDDNYGVPVFLRCELMIYDGGNSELSEACDIFDVAGSDSKLLISFASYGDEIYLLDAAADKAGDPEVIQFKDKLADIDVSDSKTALAEAAVPEYMDAEGNALAGLYDAGAADGYIGYAETLRFLNSRTDSTEVKQISIGRHGNIPLFYCDMVGISADVPDDQTDLCMDLIRIMTDKEVMKRMSVKDGIPQYLTFPRISFYDDMQEEYPMYAKLKYIAGNENNMLFRAYGSFIDDTYGR